MDIPRRYNTEEDEAARRPVHVVWELTLACDLKCQHCGSRAGPRRRDELSTAQCFELVRGLARLGARHVTLIGGEAYLRKDWLEIIRAVRGEGMDCTLQTGGLHLTPERIDQAAEAGLQAAGVSIDGLSALHDRLRGVPGSYDAAFAALRHIHARGLGATANTQITRPVVPELRELWERLLDAGVTHWQVQLTVAAGPAVEKVREGCREARRAGPIDWRSILGAADAAGLPLTKWDRIVFAAGCTETNVPGVQPLLKA